MHCFAVPSPLMRMPSLLMLLADPSPLLAYPAAAQASEKLWKVAQTNAAAVLAEEVQLLDDLATEFWANMSA